MAARRLSQLYDDHLAPEGLKVSQYSLLATAARERASPPTVHALARELGLDRTTLGHNLRPLERDGLLRLSSDPADKRVRRVVLTPAGERKLQAAKPLWRAAQARFDVAFGAGRSAALREVLTFIVHDLPLDAPASATTRSDTDHVC